MKTEQAKSKSQFQPGVIFICTRYYTPRNQKDLTRNAMEVSCILDGDIGVIQPGSNSSFNMQFSGNKVRFYDSRIFGLPTFFTNWFHVSHLQLILD